MSFSHRKATQALNFFARQTGCRINKLKALKLIFFADRYHLRKYGRPITGDRYFAMNYGPVPSASKDLAEMSGFLGTAERTCSGQFLRPAPGDPHAFESVAEVDPMVFSDSDEEALRFAWKHFGDADAFQLADLTHEYPEWKRHETALLGGEATRLAMSYEDFLDDPPAGIDPCGQLGEERRELLRGHLAQLRAFDRLWS